MPPRLGQRKPTLPRRLLCACSWRHQVIFGDRIAKVKLVEQLTLVTLQTAHHGSTPPRFASTQRNHGSRSVSIEFCNKICQERTFRTSVLRDPLAPNPQATHAPVYRGDVQALLSRVALARSVLRWTKRWPRCGLLHPARSQPPTEQEYDGPRPKLRLSPSFESMDPQLA